MSRPRKITSNITKYRMNMGWATTALLEQSALSATSIRRLENGEEITRPIAARYLHVLGMDLNNLASLPGDWDILDRGEKVVFSIKS